jgi:dolichol-phosphate mannosyltransferase
MIFVLLPVYNEAENLRSLVIRIDKGLKRHGIQYTLIAYNDGSKDESGPIMHGLTDQFPLLILGKEENMGLGYGFFTLIREVCERSADNEDIAIVLDADNSHNPELIFTMIENIHRGFDVVIASRYLPDSRIVGVSMFRQLLSIGASWMMRFLFPIKGVKDYTCGYRAYALPLLRRAIDKFGDKLVEERGFACMAELLIKLRTLNALVVEVPLLLRYDMKLGESKMKISRTIWHTLAMIGRLKRL